MEKGNGIYGPRKRIGPWTERENGREREREGDTQFAFEGIEINIDRITK